ncbi:MAG: TerB family tellurite resistance protein [Myxococcales bacterium]|nr:TerB family tellurite resistance protein [Myxococcales bacterium]
MTEVAGRAWQVVVDCVTCNTEGAATEVHAEGAEHPLTSTCAVCGRETASGELVSGGADMRDPEVARQALAAWAEREGLSSEGLADAVIGLPLEEVVHRYAHGHPVPTNLDVIAFLFPGMAAGAAPKGVNVAVGEVESAREVERTPDDPRAPARVLVSVMLADGTLTGAERGYIDRFLAAHGMEPLTPQELRPWRPHELGPLRDRELAEATLQAAVELMHLDAVRDGSELRIVRTYARVWGVDEAKITAWDRHYDRHYAPPMSSVWRALSRWVR